MKAKITIMFYAKTSRTLKNGQTPIYMRITVDGTRIEVNTNRTVEISKWSSESSKLKGNTEEARALNSYLDILKSKVYETEKDMVNNDILITPESFKNRYLGIEDEQLRLIAIFKEHNERMKSLVDKEYSYNTYKKYKTTLSHTEEFLQWKFKIKDIEIKKVNLSFINEFDYFLRSVKNCNNNSTIKYIRNFGKIIKQCYANEWIDKDPFLNFKGKVKEVERQFLSQEEIDAIMNKNFSMDRLNQVKDIFIFCCYTGLSYIDIFQLKQTDIEIGIDGNKWIFTHRQKTDTASRIPLLDIPLELLKKYENHPKCLNENKVLPVLTNQKMNSYLKEIADLCGINKELTFHIARHTFATTVTLTNGVPIESVSKMLGHTNIKTTQHYAKILDKKVSQDMMALKNILANKHESSVNHKIG